MICKREMSMTNLPLTQLHSGSYVTCVMRWNNNHLQLLAKQELCREQFPWMRAWDKPGMGADISVRR